MSVFVLGSGSCYCGCVYVGLNGYLWVIYGYIGTHRHTLHIHILTSVYICHNLTKSHKEVQQVKQRRAQKIWEHLLNTFWGYLEDY